MLITLTSAPYDLPPTLHIADGPVPERVTVAHYGRNIHFSLTTDVQDFEGKPAPVFQWTYNTAIAE